MRAEVHALLRERGRTSTQWEVGSAAQPENLVDLLLARGVVPDRDPYAVALVLRHEPRPGPAGAVARRVETFAEYVAGSEVQFEAFEDGGRRRSPRRRALLPETWADARRTDARGVDGRGDRVRRRREPGAGGPLALRRGDRAAARGRGAYRALLRARWDDAVALGTPALITQGGAMSRPILERAGFEPIGHVHMLLDEFGEDA